MRQKISTLLAVFTGILILLLSLVFAWMQSGKAGFFNLG